jgi:hypothetical protein
MAPSNAHFWKDGGWHSSEKMITDSRRFYNPVSRRPHIDLLSGSAAKTLIVTLQGVQALYAVAMSVHSSRYVANTYLGNVFLPLAIFGLLRLPAALWMSDDVSYSNKEMSPEQDTEKLTAEPQDGNQATVRFRPTDGLHGIAVRAVYLLSILALTGFTFYSVFPVPRPITPQPPDTLSATSFTQVVFFLFLMLATSCIFCFYILRGRSTESIIPCFKSRWYQLYTAVLFLGMLLLITFGAIETRKQWCGPWTTYPDNESCPPALHIQATRIQWWVTDATGNSTAWLTDFDGVIAGSFGT